MALTAVLLLLCFLAAFPALLSVPCCMIEQKNFTDARYRSIGLMRKRRGKIIFLLAGFHVLSAAVVFLLYFLSVVAAAVFIEVFTKKNLAMAVLLSVSDKLELGLLFLGAFCLLQFSMRLFLLCFISMEIGSIMGNGGTLDIRLMEQQDEGVWQQFSAQ